MPGGEWGIRVDRWFDGEAFQERPALLRIEDGRIAAVLTGAVPADGLPVLDATGGTVIPGIIDAHTHLAFDPHGDILEQFATEDDDQLLKHMRAHAAQALRAGVTTLRDLGDRSYLASVLVDELRTAEEPGPEILWAGPPITRTDGHCWFLGGGVEDTVEAMTAAVRERVDRGAHVIKVMATGGSITPGWPMNVSQFADPLLAVAVRTAHELDRPITTHAHGPGGIAAAVEAGVDGLEHAFFLENKGEGWFTDVDWSLVDAIAEAGIFVSTTTARLEQDEPLPPLHVAVRENFGRMYRAGVRLIHSSDAGVGSLKPHDCLPATVDGFARDTGVSAAEALRAVTSLPAQACGVAERKGRIAPGFDADLVVLPGDLRRDLRLLNAPELVVRQGRVAFDRANDR
ncbi:amidohydrolase family protein [Pseudonocardiaceae bacterium YIM PH 21723]|nr:amidohydrolase family protein [Pseudonocardiaceae bacterium YIM PH 21723]